jgi:hypothetical protein
VTFLERVKFVFRPQREYLIVEVPAHRTHSKWSDEIRASAATLNSHPGFLAIMDKIELQRSLLGAQLTNTFHKDLRQVDYLQAGVYWLGILQRLVQSTTAVGSKQYISPEQEEQLAFEEINKSINRLQ